MKSIITVLIALVVTLTTFAQKDFQGKATYMSKTTMDMSVFGDQMSEQQKKQRMARMKNFLEKTYTLTFTKSTSSFKENVALEAPGASGPSWGRSNGQGSIYKSTKDKKMIEDVEQFSKRFLIVEEMEQPQWEMGTETKKIGNYTCYKATLVIEDKSIDWGGMFRRGNQKEKDSTNTKKDEKKMLNVTAWYSPQIPISAGPDKYYGLPGLILEINAGRTTMLCTEVSISSDEVLEIEEPTKGKEVSREEYNEIIRVKTEELRERFQNNRRSGRGRF
ncbi:GLPGLI family protein [Polaribacter litorisediminis]|uniref:GLPGLI family protein n=1 Tax=Polaribacter litorisediminis TaxID=1908341 RepID=UPI001CBB3DD4|nr:GLPGLI family protein [Polaribacter litorisediminis]UAM98399.1 GLPGLI family protein [Polaribacter litorisediminis]